MPQELVDPEQFLDRLTKAFAQPSSSGSIWLTHKRYSYGDGETIPTRQDDDDDEGAAGPGQEHDVLIRCTEGKDVNFAARIPASRLIEFHAKYGALIKSSLAPNMRKRDKKREKARLEAREQKKREVYVDVAMTGAKRGAGHRQRQRQIAAQRKKEAEREKIEARESEQKAS